METSYTVQDLCRICLKDHMTGMIELTQMSRNTSLLPYSDLIEQIFHINPNNDPENFPKKFCKKCVNDLEASYRFKMNCESADNILHSYIYSDDPVDDDSDAMDSDPDMIEQIDSAEIETEIQEDDLFDETYEPSEHQSAVVVEKKRGKQKKEQTEGNSTVSDAKNETTKNFSKTRVKAVKADIEAGKIHICEMCGNCYKYRHALEVHMRRHRGDRPFKCDYKNCDRSFVIRFELKRHMRCHSGEKPYECRFCERKFSDFGSRIKHERSQHTGERPYVCQTCGKSFAYSHVLSGHLLTHSGEKKYHCENCGKRFTKSHHLKSHLNTHLKASNKQAQVNAQAQVAIETLSVVNVNSDEIRHFQLPTN